jgi:hypothetical protein
MIEARSPIGLSDPSGGQADEPGTVNYQIKTMVDPQLISHLRSMSPEERGTFIMGATGKFRERAEAARTVAGLDVKYTLPEVTVEGEAPEAEQPAPSEIPPAERATAEQLREKVPLLPFFIKDHMGEPSTVCSRRGHLQSWGAA